MSQSIPVSSFKSSAMESSWARLRAFLCMRMKLSRWSVSVGMYLCVGGVDLLVSIDRCVNCGRSDRGTSPSTLQ